MRAEALNRPHTATSAPLAIRVIYLLLVSNVVLRFFTNQFSLLPRIFNISDVVLTIVLFLLVLGRRADPAFVPYSRRLLVFIGIMAVGALLNVSYIYMPSAIAQSFMMAEPILLFVAIGKLEITDDTLRRYGSLLRKLVILEFLVGLIQFPLYLATGSTEVIVGTFFGNAEQYTGFLLLGVCYYLGVVKVKANSRKQGAFVFALLVLIPFVDNKASWLGVLCTLYFLMTRLGHLSKDRFAHLGVFVLIVIIGIGVVSVSSTSLSKFDVLAEAWNTGNIWNLGKIKAYQDVLEAFGSYPHMALVGSGPGTFYSRAAGQYYILPDELFLNPWEYRRAPSEYRQTFDIRGSNSMGGVIEPTLTVEPFYRSFFVKRKIFSVGTAQIDSPFSSYVGLLGETGIIGFLIYLSFYIMAFKTLSSYWTRYSDDPVVFPILTAALGLLVYTMTVSLYNPWLETGRITTILWSMIGLLYAYSGASSPKSVSPSESVRRAWSAGPATRA